MTNVELKNITKKFGDVTALDDVSISIGDGEFFVLLGPTGAGKTTTLRVIAGLEKQNAGTVLFGEETVDRIIPAERDVAFVFQQYSLYPNMTVHDNLAFPLKSPLRKKGSEDIEASVKRTAELLHISHLLDRKTAKLSGGEMQRVSIGRAIIRQPRVYLMDEPLSNLDAKLREQLRVELQHLQKSQSSTTVFVTHDQIEALTMADRLAVLDEGRILQVGTPYDIYDRPATTYVAQLVGTPRINLLGAVRENGKFNIEQTPISIDTSGDDIPEAFMVGIRPEDIRITGEGQFTGSVILTEPLGVETIVHIQIGEKELLAIMPGTSGVTIGDDLHFDVIYDRLHYFEMNGQRIT